MSQAVAPHSSRRLAVLRRGPLIALVALCVPVLANAAWVITQRRGQPLDIDEAGYAVISLNDYLGLHTGGVAGWWHEIVSQPVQAPLAPALASLLHWATGPRVLNAFAVSVLAYGVLLTVTLGLTSEWSRLGRGTALLFVAGSPVLLKYSRGFNFAELAAAGLAAALYFAHRSRSFTRTAPALAWGACLGLMLLSRTMTVAFLPGIVLAAVLPVIARRSLSGLMRVVAALFVGAGVAATWYTHNFGNVYAYLTGAGYGSQVTQYGFGTSWSIFSPHDWYLFVENMADGYFFAGEVLFLLAGWLACAVIVVRRCILVRPFGMRLRSLPGQVRMWSAGDPVVLSCAIVAVTGVAALMSTPNQGSAFMAPLVVPLVIVASCGTTTLLRSVFSHRSGILSKILTLSAAIAVIALTTVSAALTFLPMSDETIVSVPLFGGARLVLWDSRGTLRNYEDADQAPKSVGPATGRAWLAASSFADDQIWQASKARGRPPLAVFAFTDEMINTNTVGLDSLMRHRSGIALAGINPLPGDTRTADYLDQMTAIDPLVTVVATVTQGPDEVHPAVPTAAGIAYASSLHFHQFARYQLPDGQSLMLWGPAP